MNANKLTRLFDSARRDMAAQPSEQFATNVMCAARRKTDPEAWDVFAQLSEWFPRLALASAVMIILLVALDAYASASGPVDLDGGVAQISEQWLFATKGF